MCVSHALSFWHWMGRQQLPVGHWPAVPQNRGSLTHAVLAMGQSESCAQHSWHIDGGRFGFGGDTGMQANGAQHVPGSQPSWRSQQVSSLKHRFPQQISPCPQTCPPQAPTHWPFAQTVPAAQQAPLQHCVAQLVPGCPFGWRV
jgi:hypothetical protein